MYFGVDYDLTTKNVVYYITGPWCTNLLIIFCTYSVILTGNSEPYFTKESEDYIGFQDRFTYLYATVDGEKNPSYQWYQNGSKILPDPNTYFGVDRQRLRIFQRSLASQGIYQLFVSSNMGKIFGREIKVEFKSMSHDILLPYTSSQ